MCERSGRPDVTSWRTTRESQPGFSHEETQHDGTAMTELGPPTKAQTELGPTGLGPFRGTALRGTALRRTALHRTALRRTAQNFALFFSLSRLHFRYFSLSLGEVFSWNFGGVFEGRDPQMCTFGLSGCRVKPRRWCVCAWVLV